MIEKGLTKKPYYVNLINKINGRIYLTVNKFMHSALNYTVCLNVTQIEEQQERINLFFGFTHLEFFLNQAIYNTLLKK